MNSNRIIQLKKYINLLNSTQKKYFYLITIAQIALIILDLIFVAFMGVLGSLLTSYISQQPVGNRVLWLLSLLSIGTNSLRLQLIYLLGICVISILARMLFSIYLQKIAFSFLSKVSTELTYKVYRSYGDSRAIKSTKFTQQEIITATLDNINTLVTNFFGSLTFLFADLTLTIVILISLLFIDSLSTILILCIFLFLGFTIYKFTKKSSRILGAKQTNLIIQMRENITILLRQFRELKVMNYTKNIQRNFWKLSEEYYRIIAQTRVLPGINRYLWEFSSILILFTIGIVQFSMYESTRAIGNLAIFLGASLRLLPAAVRIQNSIFTFKMSMSQGELAIKLLDETNRYSDSFSTRFTNSTEGKTLDFVPVVSVEKLSYRYPDQQSNVLDDIDLNIKSGQFVGIMGESGVGKSTLMDLILGIIEPTTGTISISYVNPNVVFELWPQKVAYVSQNTYIAPGSLRENLLFGVPNNLISDDILIQTLNKAHLGDFLNAQKDGLDTKLSEEGNSISGGQRQRIGIARALVFNPKLIIFDEVTNSLDMDTETQIAKLFDELKGESSLLVISHSPETLKYADVIYLLKNGKLIEKFNDKFEN